jgi:hypothetical protein
MESYSIVRTDDSSVVEELHLTLAQLQGIYSSCMMRHGFMNIPKVIVKSTDIGQPTTILLPYESERAYYTFFSHPLAFAKKYPMQIGSWNLRYYESLRNQSSITYARDHNAKGLLLTLNKIGFVAFASDLVTDNIDEYKSGVLLLDRILGNNDSYYICETNPDGTLGNYQFFSRLQGFNWYGLPRELREIIMSYNRVEWITLSKQYYNHALSLLNNTFSFFNYRRAMIIIRVKTSITKEQKQYIINQIKSPFIALHFDFDMTRSLFDPEIREVYTNEVLGSKSKVELMSSALVNISYVMYLSKKMTISQKELDEIIEVARVMFRGHRRCDKGLFTSIATSVTYLAYRYNLIICWEQIKYIIDESSRCYTEFYITNYLMMVLPSDLEDLNKSSYQLTLKLVFKDLMRDNLFRVARIFVELFPIISLDFAKTIYSEASEYGDSDIIISLISHPSLISTNLTFILEDILSPENENVDSDLLIGLLGRPNTIVSSRMLVHIAEKRHYIMDDMHWVIQAALSNPSVSYENFKLIYETQIQIEYHENMQQYYRNILKTLCL